MAVIFICRPRLQGPKDGIRGNAKPCGTLVPIGVGIAPSISRRRVRGPEARSVISDNQIGRARKSKAFYVEPQFSPAPGTLAISVGEARD